MFYHGCGPAENPSANSDHSFWVYPCGKPTVNSWDTHLPVGLYCNNHMLMGSCIEDMTLTEFECMGHSSEADSAVIYTGALPLPLPLPPSRSVSPALSSASGSSAPAAAARVERSVSPVSETAGFAVEDSYSAAEELATAISSYKLGRFEPTAASAQEQEQQEQQEQSSSKAIADLLDRIVKLEQRQQYSTVYRIVAELFALLLLSLYFLKSTPHVVTSSRDVDL